MALAVFVLVCSAGCAESHDSAAAGGDTAVPSAHTSGFRTPLPLVALEQLNFPPLKCQSPETCPPAVGELVALTFRGPLNCTATLVAPQIILTASHCVPWENVSADRKFNGNCWIRWPQAPGAEKGRPREPMSVACDRLLSATELGPDTRSRIYPDHAFIQLAAPQTGRVPMAIAASDSPGKSDSALLYGINPGNDVHILEFQHCHRNDHFEVPDKVSISEEAIVFPSCRVLHGFSGGPILEPLSRQIIGVISGVVGFDSQNPEKPLTSIGTSVRPWRGAHPHGK